LTNATFLANKELLKGKRSTIRVRPDMLT